MAQQKNPKAAIVSMGSMASYGGVLSNVITSHATWMKSWMDGLLLLALFDARGVHLKTPSQHIMFDVSSV
jgi:hypothetical protein